MNESKLGSFKFLVNVIANVTKINFRTVVKELEITLEDTHQCSHLDIGYQLQRYLLYEIVIYLFISHR